MVDSITMEYMKQRQYGWRFSKGCNDGTVEMIRYNAMKDCYEYQCIFDGGIVKTGTFEENRNKEGEA